jgi:hypothetical protein
MLQTPVYGSMGSELVEKDPKTNVNSGLGLWRSRGPERFQDHLRKEKPVSAPCSTSTGAIFIAAFYSYVDPTLMGKDSDTSVGAAMERARDFPSPLTTNILPQRGPSPSA